MASFTNNYDPWPTWTSNQVSVTATTSVTGDQTWRVWVNGQQTPDTLKLCNSAAIVSVTGTSVTDAVWRVWSSGTQSYTDTQLTSATNVFNTWVVSDEQYKARTKEQKRAQAERQREYQARIARQLEERRLARGRAKKILAENLTELQRRTLEEHGWFDVQVKGRTFRIHNNRYQHNVIELDTAGNKLREFCAHTSHACPQEDHALAQKLMLEHALDDFCKIANVWDRRGRRKLISSSGTELVLPA